MTKGSTLKEDSKKKESLERIKNQLSQAETNLKTASTEGDQKEISYWSNQVRLIRAILKKVAEIQSR
jgi:hypothetical protein